MSKLYSPTHHLSRKILALENNQQFKC